ncbi:flagellin FliC [Leclercia adecarboxylata]|nr:flagellin FliC [Leclercia adecarboxylata]MEB5749920.1 flagellin FliC [Leclercia adecarboxylata]QGW19381.1 flagellin FliC [Leclercia sp. Colony189]QVV62290.1 flagellin FliC [Leclercia sp. Colony189]URM25267.1 flagellin FliC [Leclercia adecarboxylata]
MMAVINTNLLSLTTQNNLNKSQSSLGTAIERLSSGLRINSAKDDAAGQAISNRFTSNIKGLTQASRNANDGISLAQTAEGSLNEINNNLQRIRELSVQAQNGTNSASDIDSIQSEVNQRLLEINRVAQQTQFNGSKILANNTADTDIKIQVGANDNESIDIGIKANADWNKLGANSVGADTATQAFASYTSNVVTSSSDTAASTSASGTAVSTMSLASVGTDARSVSVLSGGFDVLSTDVLSNVDAAIKAVDNQRSDLGAIQNRFESTISNLSNTITNLSAAQSRIQDADYATEVSNMSRAQILQQAGTSVLSQANQVPQGVLSLLR